MRKSIFYVLPSLWERIWSQCAKELAQLRRDIFSLLLLFIMPLVTMLIYGYAIKLLITEVPLLVQDFDQSFLSRSYIERFEASHRFKIISLPLYYSQTKDILGNIKKDPLLDSLDRNIAKAILVIPPDFSRHLKDAQTTKVQILLDGTDVNNARAIRSTIRTITEFFLTNVGLQPSSSPITLQSRLWSNMGGKESHFILPGVYGLILWVYPALFSALSMAREKEQGTIIQAYSADMSAVEFFLGKGLAYFIVGVIQTIFVMSLGFFIFGIKLVGDPIPLLIGTLIFLMSASLFGLMLGTRANSRIVAVQSVTLLGYLTSSFLTGLYHPLRNVPFPLSVISNILPVKYYIDVSRDAFLRGAGWSGVWFANLAILMLGILIFKRLHKMLHKMQFPD